MTMVIMMIMMIVMIMMIMMIVMIMTMGMTMILLSVGNCPDWMDRLKPGKARLDFLSSHHVS